jgi:hypothetical protein
MQVPEGFTLLIKADPRNALGSIIQVATSAGDCINVNNSWPLIPNEFITWSVKDASAIWFSCSATGNYLLFTVEKVRR